MKLKDIETFVVGNPPPHYGGRYFVFVKLMTDDGVTGIGEAYCVPFHPDLVVRMLEDVFGRYFAGRDPHAIEATWRRVYSSGFSQHPDLTLMGVLSALEMACWDIVGKAANQPLFKLWGAVNQRIPAYGSGGFANYSIEDLISEARTYAAMGCKYYKMKIHHADPRENRRRVEAVQRALGGGVRMMVDVNQRLDVLGNQRQAAALEDLDLVWYEEPVLADDFAACAEVARSIEIPVATGENNYTRFEFRDLVERRAASYLMPDVCRANGFSETLRIGRHAAAHQVALAPHVVHELSIQVVGALSNGFLVEFIDWTPPDLFQEMPKCRDGAFLIPECPGHGMALAKGAKEKYRTA